MKEDLYAKIYSESLQMNLTEYVEFITQSVTKISGTNLKSKNWKVYPDISTDMHLYKTGFELIKANVLWRNLD